MPLAVSRLSLPRMVYLTRREHFSAAHKLWNPNWTEEENQKVFGICANKNFHGHNFNLFVTVKGNPDPQTGLIINLKELSRIINAVIIDRIDHRNANLEVDFLKGIIPSTENIVKAIWKELKNQLKGCELHCVKLYETENNYAAFYGEGENEN